MEAVAAGCRHAYGVPWACDLQGMVLTVVELAIVAWNAFIAYNTYAWLMLKREPELLKRRINPVLFVYVARRRYPD